jgi:hypothetical protein
VIVNGTRCRQLALTDGQALLSGQYMMSQNGEFALAAQTDGNLVLCGGLNSLSGALWATGTSASATARAMQNDGNLVLYGPTVPSFGQQVPVAIPVMTSSSKRRQYSAVQLEQCPDVVIRYRRQLHGREHVD